MQISRWKLWIGVERLSVSSSLLTPPSHDYRWKRAEGRKNTIAIIYLDVSVFSPMQVVYAGLSLHFLLVLGLSLVSSYQKYFPAESGQRRWQSACPCIGYFCHFFCYGLSKFIPPLLLYFLATLSISDESKTS